MAKPEQREHSSSLIPANGLLRAVLDDQNRVIGYEPIIPETQKYFVLMPDRRRPPRIQSDDRTASHQFTGRAASPTVAPALLAQKLLGKHSEIHRRAEQARILAAPTVPPTVQLVQAARPKRRTGPRVVYVAAVDREKGLKRISSERDQQIFKLIASVHKGRSRAELLAKLDTTQTGIVDGALRRLFRAKLLSKVAK